MAAPPPAAGGKYLHMNDTLFTYMVGHGVREHPVLQKLRACT